MTRDEMLTACAFLIRRITELPVESTDGSATLEPFSELFVDALEEFEIHTHVDMPGTFTGRVTHCLLCDGVEGCRKDCPRRLGLAVAKPVQGPARDPRALLVVDATSAENYLEAEEAYHRHRLGAVEPDIIVLSDKFYATTMANRKQKDRVAVEKQIGACPLFNAASMVSAGMWQRIQAEQSKRWLFKVVE